MANGKKHLAFYLGSLQKGGTERVVANLAEYFYESGWQVTLVTQYRYEEEYAVSPGIGRILSDLTPEELSAGRVTNLIRRFRKLRGIWKKTKPDLIFSCIGKNNFMAIATALLLPVPVAVSVRGEPSAEYNSRGMRLIAWYLFALADGVVLQTSMARNFFPAVTAGKAVILPNPINPLFIRPVFDGEREKRVVTVGRVDENKNQRMIIDAFAGLIRKFPEYTLTIYGKGEALEGLRRYVNERGLEEKVFLPGSIADVSEAIHRAAVFVLSSDTEGMPNALIEAMAAGLAVISTDCPCGGPGELIRPEVNGLLVPVRDTRALEQALERLMGDPAYAAVLGRAAASVQDTLAPSKVHELWKRYFEGLMKYDKNRGD